MADGRNTAESSADCSTVRVQLHQPDYENLAEQVAARIADVLENKLRPRCLFANPIATVTCKEPTTEFFQVVRKRQAEWCKRASTTFSRRTRRSVKNWVVPEGSSSKYERFLQRSLCFTGLLFIDGCILPSHEWLRIQKAAAPKVRQQIGITRNETSIETSK